ncbi:hypothetical protein NEIG_02681 [Nematocida sp. ERTm5]|nr:hypothetical protein NEIG_02681 [Nematocida sp. ERTm5]
MLKLKELRIIALCIVGGGFLFFVVRELLAIVLSTPPYPEPEMPKPIKPMKPMKHPRKQQPEQESEPEKESGSVHLLHPERDLYNLKKRSHDLLCNSNPHIPIMLRPDGQESQIALADPPRAGASTQEVPGTTTQPIINPSEPEQSGPLALAQHEITQTEEVPGKGPAVPIILVIPWIVLGAVMGISIHGPW